MDARCCFRWLTAGLLVVGVTAAIADEPVTSPAPAPLKPLLDYRGKGFIQVTIPDASVRVGFEQAYVAPETLLFQFEMPPVKQWSWATTDRERIFNPTLGYVVERRYKNLDRMPTSPSLALQMSMAQYGRIIRELKSVQLLGSVKLLGQDCHLIRFSNKDLVDNLINRGLIGDTAVSYLAKGVTQAWLTQEHGLPLKIQMHGADASPAILLSFSEVKINSGLKTSDLKMPVPAGTPVIPVTCDLANPNWEMDADKDVQKQVDAIQAALNRRPQ